MAGKSSLYGGFIKGKATAIQLGPNNPALDTGANEQIAKAKLRAHVTAGIKPAVTPKAGPARPLANKGVKGRNVSGSARIKGGGL